jgi:hypothetical protein
MNYPKFHRKPLVKFLSLICGLVIIMLVADRGSSRAAQGAPTADSLRNIALGKPYTLDPKPNYQYCSEDAKQLTDGYYAKSLFGLFWTQKTTVGWLGKQATITIDLGAVQPIKGVSYNTSAGTSEVQWPSAIDIFVSDDGKNFYEAGDLVSLSDRLTPSPPAKTLQVHRYWTDALSTHGRYLSLVVFGEPYIFVDEIEVYEGNPSLLGIPHTGNPISDFRSFLPQMRVSQAITARLREDIKGIRTALRAKPLAPPAREAIAAQLVAAEQGLRNPVDRSNQDFRAVMPLNALHERIFRVQAQLWRAMGLPLVSVWQSGLWDPLPPIHNPSLEPVPAVQVDMMLNEYRAVAFNISNASDEPKTLRLKIDGLPGGINPPYLTVHEVAWTGTSGGHCFPAALPEAEKSEGAFLIRLTPGLTRQVWFTCHPQNIAPGSHRGRILLSGAGIEIVVPLVLHLYPLHFPDQPTLHLGGWDYTDQDAFYDITPQNRDQVIAHLRSHFVDTPWATATVLPFASLAAAGSYRVDTTAFDNWVQRWRGARQYCVYINAGGQLGGSPMGTPEFSKKVQDWIRFWSSQAQRRGLRPEQMFLLLVDEPRTPAEDETILQWALAIRAAGTGVKIWEDPLHHDPFQANQDMIKLCDVLCPDRWSLLSSPGSARYFSQRRQQGTELALYSASGPARELDPYTYYRLQAWACWQYGALGSHFWSFADAGKGSSWNEYDTIGTGNTPFFLDQASVTPGKQMEAIREGVEDYEYLVMLRQNLSLLKGKGLPVTLLQEASDLLSSAPKEVCGAPPTDLANWKNWLTEKDRTGADRLRIRILKVLSALQKHLPADQPAPKSAPLN